MDDNETNWAAMYPCIHIALVEMYYGNRVLRQFGYHQPVPMDPMIQDELDSIDMQGKTEKNWPKEHSYYVQWWNSRADHCVPCIELQPSDFDFSIFEYHRWYLASSSP